MIKDLAKIENSWDDKLSLSLHENNCLFLTISEKNCCASSFQFAPNEYGMEKAQKVIDALQDWIKTVSEQDA